MKKSERIEPFDLHAVFSTHWPALSLLVVLAIGNSMFFLSMDENTARLRGQSIHTNVLRTGMLFAVLSSEIGLHSVWTVFGRGPIGGRYLVSAVAAWLLLVSVYFPALLAFGLPFAVDEFLIVVLVLLPILFAAQMPLWIVKSAWGSQICRPGSESEWSHPARLSIGGLMIVTAVVGTLITGIRITSALSGVSLAMALIPVVIGTWLAALISCVTIVPSLFAMLKARSLVWALAVFLLISAGPVVAWILFLAMLNSTVSFEWGGTVWVIAGCSTAYGVVLTTPLLVARRMGYRLQRCPPH